MKAIPGTYTTVSEYCRFLIQSGDLARKLAPPKQNHGTPLQMDRPASELLTQPVREDCLKMSGNAPKLPQFHQLHNPEARAKCIHRFAHHELQAVELFAWAILRWPQMPDAMKKGFLNTIAEEQKHLRLYINRLKAHGIEFGHYPLSDYFWRHVPTLDQSPEGPKAFLCAMGLTLEQANLDFTLMYKKAFEDAGDSETAQVMQIVHDEEIGHVRLAKTWLNKLEESPNDLDNYLRNVPFPFGATRAKGRQFFVAPRQDADLNSDFIEYVHKAQKEWVKKPVVLFPNFGGEEPVKSKNKNHVHAIKILFQTFWQTMESTHRTHPALSQDNPFLPKTNELLFFPWLATPEAQAKAIEQKRRLWGPSPELVNKWHTKSHALQWAQQNGFENAHLQNQLFFLPPDFFDDAQAEFLLQEKINAYPESFNQQITLKPNWGFSGRGRVGGESALHFDKVIGATKRMCQNKKGAVLEPWLTRVKDYSVLLWLHENGSYDLKILQLLNNTSGMYCGHDTSVPEDIEISLQNVGAILAQNLQQEHYIGPAGLDAFTFQLENKIELRPVVEINARMTMGHLAWWVLSYFSESKRTRFAFHPQLQNQKPHWAKVEHVLFENGPVVFCD